MHNTPLRSYFRARWRHPQGYREILRIGLPLMASMASSTIMQFTDRYFLARYSMDAVGAALPSSMIFITLLLTIMGVCGYAAVLVAQYMGAKARHRIGSALWQGLWVALAGGALLGGVCLLAEPIFAVIGHERHLQELEATYFRILAAGGVFPLAGSVLSAFFTGRGQTRPVMTANILGAAINVPLDYLFIFGGFGLPSMGIAGAAAATVIGGALTCGLLGLMVFTKANDKEYNVISGCSFEPDMLGRLLRFGLPSGLNMFAEMAGMAWFSLEIGVYGTVSLAAGNIAFSINSLIFMPALGLHMAVSTLVGQAMGRHKPLEAEAAAKNALLLAAVYMVSVALCIACFAPELVDIFRPAGAAAEFAPVRELGVVLLYFIVVYSCVDCCNVVFFGALKGAGDTMGVLMLMAGGLIFFLILPILTLKALGAAGVYSLWTVFTVYIIALAFGALIRFSRREWHNIRVVETVPEGV